MPYENINRRNHFSVLDAREAMWRALTLRDANGVGLIPATPLTNEDLRKIYWATAFRTVGDVIHTLQDMGNPQHSRNEGHATAGYEEYIDARARQSEKFTIDNRTLLLLKGQLPDLIYEASYPVPRFNRYSDYWSTRVNSANIFGLSDYSNRGFFTLENNFGNTAIYTEPSSVLANYTVVPVFQSSYDDYNVYGARFNHFVGPVEDKLTNSTDTVTMTTQSVFTGLSANGGAVVPPKYSLNAKNYDDRAALLIPRAVAYSAGLIDHFFRGQLEITPPDEGVYSLVDHFAFSGAGQPATAPTTGFKGFKTIKLKLRNATPDIAPSGGGNTAPQIMPGGNLVAVLKFYRNTAYTDNLANEPTNSSTYTTTRSAAEEIVVSTRVKDANGNLLGAVIPVTTTAQTFIFEFDQELPINATDVKLQVVYRGVLGSEADAVVVETVDISEPSYFTYMNASDYIGIGSSVYTRLQINTSPTLLSKVRPTTCVDAMTNQLREGPGDCFAVKPINFSMKFGTNNNANADVGVANTGQYHRLAMLTTAGGTANIGLTGAVCNAGGSFQLPGRTMQTNYFTEANGTAGTEVIVDPMATPPTRGVPFWRGVICLHDGDQTSFANFPVSWWSPMSTNTGADLFPLATQNFRFGTP